MSKKVALVTGRLAEKPLQRISKQVANTVVVALNVGVAAFMTTSYLSKHYVPKDDISKVIISGKCKNVDTKRLNNLWGCKVVKGPKDLKDIPAFILGNKVQSKVSLHDYDIEIFAEIVDAPLLSLDDIIEKAKYYRKNGADVIDLGCIPGKTFYEVGKVVSCLKKEGFKVSIDTFDSTTIKIADEVGVDFVLSINSSNIDIVSSLSACPIIIPNFDNLTLGSLKENVRKVKSIIGNKKFIIDPVISPFNVNFVESIVRYYEARKLYPETNILMGIGNLTELTEADSPGLNLALISIAQEMGIKYVLTTEVINWGKGSVKEVDIARRISYLSYKEKLPPKNISDLLVILKDPSFSRYNIQELKEMQGKIKDRNWRIFVTDKSGICVFNRDKFIIDDNISRIFKEMNVEESNHAFYIGKELYKANLSLLLNKKYEQDQSLRWGYINE